MSRVVQVGAVTLTFSPSWTVLNYDGVDYYQKAIKDYRANPRTKPSNLIDDVAAKARDTLSGLMILKVRTGGTDRVDADAITTWTRRIRAVLYLEQPVKPSNVKPTILDPKTAQQALERAVGKVDNNPRVVSAATPSPPLPWTATLA